MFAVEMFDSEAVELVVFVPPVFEQVIAASKQCLVGFVANLMSGRQFDQCFEFDRCFEPGSC